VSGRGRRGRIRRAIPWVAAAAAVGLAVLVAWRAFAQRDLVEVAHKLRLGDVEAGVAPDPVGALAVLDDQLAEVPEDYEAWIESALAWQDLRSPLKSVECFQKAAECSDDTKQKVSAKSKAMLMLTAADDYEGAVKLCEEVIALQPDSPLRPLQLGTIHLQGSLVAQRAVLERLKIDPLNKRMLDVRREKLVEEYVSDIWREPLVEPLLDELGANDAVVRAEVRVGLSDARDRFRLAYQALLLYPRWGEFDASIARAYCQVLQRAGLLYDAHIEASTALREQNLPLAMVRDLLEVQANCSLAMGDVAQAADRYALILNAYIEQAPDRIPYHLGWAEYALRVKAQQWDWILSHVDADRETYDDLVLQWAKAAALAATGRRDEARLEIAEPFNAVALGTETFTPPSLRAWPDRRREIAMLDYQLFSEIGDSRAGGALDALLAQVPDDAEALRLHAELSLAADDLEGARRDAFALLTRGRRDHADFLLWMDVADRITLRRHNVSLAARAHFKVSEYLRSTENRTEATVEEFKLLGLTKSDDLLPKPADPLYVVGDPAFSLAIVDELVANGDMEKALTEMRKLLEEYPEAQELRFRLGLLLVRAGLYESALQKFEELLAKVPDDVEALDLAMRTNRALGRRQEAANLLDRMILDDPLGVGVSRHGLRLIEEGKADEAVKLVERIARWTKLGDRPDVLVLAARAQLAQGHLDQAQAILANLLTRDGHTLANSLLALDLGLALGQTGLVDEAIEAIRPLLPELLPDQLEEIAQRLAGAGRMEDLVELFTPEITALPSARPVLRTVADALKQQGDFDRADSLLAELDDEDALIDRFLLLGLLRRQDELAHPLRLDPSASEHTKTAQFCLMLANALEGEPALTDSRLVDPLTELGVGAGRPEYSLQLLDALLRILPALGRLDDVRPAGAVEHPETAWPAVAEDVGAVLTLAQTDRPAARRLGRDLLFLALLEGREFWTREATALAEQLLIESPGLSLPHRVLARAALAAGEPHDALRHLQPLLAHQPLSYEDLAQFLQACHDAGHTDWATASALHFGNDLQALRVLGDALASWKLPDQAATVYSRVLEAAPDDLPAQRGMIAVLAELKQGELVVPAIRKARAQHADDRELATTCAEALLAMPVVPPLGQEQAREIEAAFPEQFASTEVLVRLERGHPEELQAVLDGLLARLEAGTIPVDAPGLPMALVRIARAARLGDQPAQARALLRHALGADPGSLSVYRELAQLELDQNNLDTARRYLDLLTFVDQYDRDAGLTLAQLHFQRLGQPDKAADVVRRTYPGSMPIEAAEILAAEAYLHGHIKEALNQFFNAARSPLISADTYLTVARIAYAGGVDDVARQLYDQVLQKLPPDDPRRPRAQWLREERLAAPADAPPAEGEAPAAGADAGAAPAESPPAAAASTAGAPSPPN
jgi:tetratricopeptide (TPR) repeat protein